MEEKNKIDAVADEIKNSKTVRSLFTWIIALSSGFVSFFGVAILISNLTGIEVIGIIAGIIISIPVVRASLKYIDLRKKYTK